MMTGKLSPVRKLHSLMSDLIYCFLHTPNDSETPQFVRKSFIPLVQGTRWRNKSAVRKRHLSPEKMRSK